MTHDPSAPRSEPVDGNIVANAFASGSSNTLTSVEFFLNGTKVGEDNVAPYSYRFTAPTAIGTYVFSARATDSTGLARDAQVPLTVTSAVGQPPTVNLITPINNSVVVPGAVVNLAASALATGGTIASVQFYANGSPAAINSSNAVTTVPFVSTFTPTAPNTYVFDAIATDDRGNTIVSNAVTVTAAFGTPTITITSPKANSTARAAPNIPLAITVINTNDNWAGGADAAIIAAAATAGGAFPLANGSKDAAMLLMLAPGSYTVQVTGVGNTTGIGLVEVYDVDP